MTFADVTNTVLDFVRQHPNWSAFIVFGLTLGESLPFASLILPFWAMLVGIGTIMPPACIRRTLTSAGRSATPVTRPISPKHGVSVEFAPERYR